jgi:hypothetical protein
MLFTVTELFNFDRRDGVHVVTEAYSGRRDADNISGRSPSHYSSSLYVYTAVFL